MNTCKTFLGLIILTLTSLIAISPVFAQTHYTFTEVDGPGSYGTYLYGIRSKGLFSGLYEDTSGYSHGLLWTKGKLPTVNHPGSLDTEFGAINDYGLAIGNYDNAVVGSAAFYDALFGVWIPLADISRTVINTGNGINNLNQATGTAFDGTYSNGIG